MKFLKKKWFWIVLVIIVVIIVAIVKFSSQEAVTYITEKASKQDLKQTVEVTGSVKSAADVDLNFTITGTLEDIMVESGDQVKEGELLAQLLAGDVRSQVTDAQAALDLARTELEELLAGASQEDVKVVEEEVASAKTAYQTAIDTLDNLERTRDQEIANLKAEALNTVNDKLSVVQYALDVVEDAIIDDVADSYLKSTDADLLASAQSGYYAAYNNYLEMDDLIADAEETNSHDDIILAADTLEGVLEQTLFTLNRTFDVMSATVENSVYTAAIIASFKTDITTQSTSVNTAIAAVQSDSSDLNTRDLYYKTEIINANNSIEAKLTSLNLAQAKLDLKIAKPRDFEIRAIQAKIKQAQARVSRYVSDLSETLIKAPFDGIITKVSYDKGEQTSLANPVVSIMGLSEKEIEVDIPESDVVKIAVADEVIINLDAFTGDEEFKGAVIFIDPAATIIDGVIYYQTKVSFSEVDDRIKSGMTADLTIMTDSKDNTLVIPARAVVYKENKKYVQVLVNGTPLEKEVQTGLRGDGGFIEIISGLEENEEVITFIKENK